MKSQLSLRQNKIIQLLRDSKDYLTSDEIAAMLDVSSRTVRNDIADISEALAAEGITIESSRSKGFILHAADKSALKKHSKDNNLFMGRSDRLYYIAVKLCTSYEPVDFFDLEEEIAVSSSTLTSDLAYFKKRFCQNAPYIEMNSEKNHLLLERNEFKRRFILTKILSDNWDYNSTANVYYDSDFMGSEEFNIINANVCDILYENDVHLEDYYLISLNLYLSIAYHRIKAGFLIDPHEGGIPSDKYTKASESLFRLLGEKLDFAYPQTEVTEIAHYLEEKDIPISQVSSATGIFQAGSDNTIKLADAYLDDVYNLFGIDLRHDEVFMGLLKKNIERLKFPLRDLTVRQSPDNIKLSMIPEFIIASFFAKSAFSFGVKVNEDDLLYLTPAISGALYKLCVENNAKKINAVLLCHLGMNDMWALSCKIRAYFGNVLNLKDIIPVNHKNQYDFSGVDVIISTVNKQVTMDENKPVLQISPYLSIDDRRILDEHLSSAMAGSLFSGHMITITKLLDNAYVHERQNFSSRFDLMEYMAGDFISDDIFTQEHLQYMLNREAVSTYDCSSAVLMLYCLLPAKETKLSVCTLDHRIVWNSHKIRTVFMLSLKKEDMNQLFYIMNNIYGPLLRPDDLKRFKTIKELKEYYKGF